VNVYSFLSHFSFRIRTICANSKRERVESPPGGIQNTCFVLFLPYPIRPSGGPVDDRNKLCLSMLLLVISFGKDWIAQSMLEYSVAKKNLRFMSDMQRVFWIVWFRMVSLLSLFLHPQQRNCQLPKKGR